jgi:hypothetical protein
MMLPANPKRLLEVARRMPEAANLVIHMDELRRLFEAALGLVINGDDFNGRALLAWTRGSVGGITLDEITLASIIEASAHLSLDHPRRLKLRSDIGDVNQRILARIEEGTRT